MKGRIILFCLLAGFLFLQTGMTANQSILMKGDNSYWKCAAYDTHNKQWIAHSPYQRTAINRAWGMCKKQSQAPESCKTATEYCEAIIHGKSTRPMWQCTALDQMAKPWKSDVYSKRNDAALGAKAYCKQNSGSPHSCYVNLLTCENLNSGH